MNISLILLIYFVSKEEMAFNNLCKMLNKEIDECTVDVVFKGREENAYEVSFILTKKDYCQIKNTSFDQVVDVSKGVIIDKEICYKKIKVIVGKIFEKNSEEVSMIIDKNKELIIKQSNLFYSKEELKN